MVREPRVTRIGTVRSEGRLRVHRGSEGTCAGNSAEASPDRNPRAQTPGAVSGETLLDKATSHRSKHGNRRGALECADKAEALDLALAFVRRQVGPAEVAAALGCSRQNTYQFCLSAIRRAVVDGRLEFVVRP